MSTKQIKTTDINGSELAAQGPSLSKSSRLGNNGRHHANPVISKQMMWSSQENKIIMECCLLSESKVRGYRKRMLSLWLNKAMFWVSSQKLVDQANTICSNSWMPELEIAELQWTLAENDSYKEQERSADDTGSNLGKKVGDILIALEADQEIGNLEEEEVAIIQEIAEVLERKQQDKLPVLRDIPKKSC